jgi:DNA/RNA endonuclease YhcR with UshA esterase domain
MENYIERNKLLFICLLISISGILILMVLSIYLEPRLSKVKDLSIDNVYERIRVEGNVFQVKKYDEFAIIKISDDTGSINVLSDKTSLNLTKDDSIKVIGKAIEYKGDIEINAEKIYQNYK